MVNKKCYDLERCNSIRKRRLKNQEKYCQIWQDKFDSFFKECKNKNAKIQLDTHFHKRSYQRVINQSDLITVLENGEVIEQSKNNNGVVRVVLFSYIRTAKSVYRPIHVVLEYITETLWSVITVYSPSSHPWKWNETYDERICFCKNEEGSN